jgi:hypothetical protein
VSRDLLTQIARHFVPPLMRDVRRWCVLHRSIRKSGHRSSSLFTSSGVLWMVRTETNRSPRREPFQLARSDWSSWPIVLVEVSPREGLMALMAPPGYCHFPLPRLSHPDVVDVVAAISGRSQRNFATSRRQGRCALRWATSLQHQPFISIRHRG